jgi:hypothetical protein
LLSKVGTAITAKMENKLLTAVTSAPPSMNLTDFRTGPGTAESSGSLPTSRFSKLTRADWPP